MTFFNEEYSFYCGVDLHARTMYVCIIDERGKKVVHCNLKTNPEAFLKQIAPYRDNLVVGVECVFCWYWLADLCQAEQIRFVLGHALYMKAIHGGKTKNDRLDAFKLASLLRGGNFPIAYAYPAAHRATRDLLRRRHYLMRNRAEVLAHVQNTVTQYNLPPLRKKVAYKANRVGVAEHFPDLIVRKSIEVDLSLIDHFDAELKKLELTLEKTAKLDDPQTFYLLQTIPGVGSILAMTILYEINTIERFSRVQDFVSYCRLVRPSKRSAGKPVSSSSGKKIGNAHLKWAFSEATVLLLRCDPDIKRRLDRLAQKHGKGKALSILSAKLGRVVYYMLKRGEAFDVKRFLAQ
jgi:transposase